MSNKRVVIRFAASLRLCLLGQRNRPQSIMPRYISKPWLKLAVTSGISTIPVSCDMCPELMYLDDNKGCAKRKKSRHFPPRALTVTPPALERCSIQGWKLYSCAVRGVPHSAWTMPSNLQSLITPVGIDISCHSSYARQSRAAYVTKVGPWVRTTLSEHKRPDQPRTHCSDPETKPRITLRKEYTNDVTS